MKKTAFLACFVMILFMAACSGGQTEQQDTELSATATAADMEPEPTATASSALPDGYETPADLLGEVYNPFCDVVWPEGYTTYQVCYESGDYDLYRLYLTAEGSAEDVATFMSTLVGDAAEESIAQNIESLKNGGVQIPGTQVEGLSADVGIEPTDAENERYAYVEGFEIMISAGIDPGMAEDYAAILDMNFNADAIAYIGAADFLTENEPASREVRLMTGATQAVQAECFYDTGDDYETWKTYFTSAQFADNDDIQTRIEDGYTQLSYYYGDISVSISMSDEDQMIWIGQWQNGTAQNIADYVPAQTLQLMGFGAVGDDGACWYEDNAAGTYISVNNTEWGADGDCIMMMMDGYDAYIVGYYPAAGQYSVEIGKNGKWAKYYYDIADGSIEPIEGNDEADIRYNMSEITGDDSEDNIKWPIDDFDKYIKDTFGMAPDALFDVPYN
ncbi:MAG: hypothetical protein PHO15_07355 [Eubacteriales bacterium]|nr:hypothetical protein [Eubacteriales bacterium]